MFPHLGHVKSHVEVFLKVLNLLASVWLQQFMHERWQIALHRTKAGARVWYHIMVHLYWEVIYVLVYMPFYTFLKCQSLPKSTIRVIPLMCAKAATLYVILSSFPWEQSL